MWRAASIAAIAVLAACPGTAQNHTPSGEAGACPDGKKVCGGECVDATDPFFGCGADTCLPCNADHVTLLSCRLGVGCVVEHCDTGFDNCDNRASNGCEADLRDGTHCGRCGNACAAGLSCGAKVVGGTPDCLACGSR